MISTEIKLMITCLVIRKRKPLVLNLLSAVSSVLVLKRMAAHVEASRGLQGG